MARPKDPHRKRTIEIQASPKMIAYLDQVKAMEGFGDTRPEIVKRFVWDGIFKLLAEKLLKKL
jgi:hypothetical protein